MAESVIIAPARMQTADVIKAWLIYCRRQHTQRTFEHYEGAIWRFYRYAPEEVVNLTPEHIEHLLADLAKTRTNRTLNSNLIAVKSFCRFMHDRYDLPNPAEKVKLLCCEPPRQRVLTPVEYQQLLAVCTAEEAFVVKLLAHTGLRATEAVNLKWCNINDDLTFVDVIGKGRKRRLIPINATLKAVLGKPNGIYLLKSIRTRWNLASFCEKISKRAGIRKANPHSFRHYFATQMLKKAPLHLVSKCLGHADSKTTELIYWHFVAEQDLAGLTDVLDK